MKKRKLRRAIAHHEAAHLVIAWHYGMPLESVAIGGRAHGGSRPRHRRALAQMHERLATEREDQAPESRLRAEQIACTLLAGRLAQRRVSAKSLRRYRARGDRKAVDRMLSGVCGSRAELRIYRRLLKQRTADLLDDPGIWRAVSDVARALAKRGRITPEEALERIIRGAVFFGSPKRILNKLQTLTAGEAR